MKVGSTYFSNVWEVYKSLNNFLVELCTHNKSKEYILGAAGLPGLAVFASQQQLSGIAL